MSQGLFLRYQNPTKSLKAWPTKVPAFVNFDKNEEQVKRQGQYPDKQTVLRVWEDGNPYSNALSSSSFVAVILLTGGDFGLGADTTSY